MHESGTCSRANIFVEYRASSLPQLLHAFGALSASRERSSWCSLDQAVASIA
jgi:hypothetical protein